MTTPLPPPSRPGPIGYAVANDIEAATNNGFTSGAELSIDILILNPDNTVLQTVTMKVNFHYGDTSQQIRAAILTAWSEQFGEYELFFADRNW